MVWSPVSVAVQDNDIIPSYMAMGRAPSSTTCLLPHSELDRCHPYPLPPHPSSAPAASPAPPATRDPGGVPTSQSPPRPPPTSAARPAQWQAEAASPATTTHPPSPPSTTTRRPCAASCRLPLCRAPPPLPCHAATPASSSSLGQPTAGPVRQGRAVAPDTTGPVVR
jgi:hypothetical protein